MGQLLLLGSCFCQQPLVVPPPPPQPLYLAPPPPPTKSVIVSSINDDCQSSSINGVAACSTSFVCSNGRSFTVTSVSANTCPFNTVLNTASSHGTIGAAAGVAFGSSFVLVNLIQTPLKGIYWSTNCNTGIETVTIDFRERAREKAVAPCSAQPKTRQLPALERSCNRPDCDLVSLI
jgi:hypothetical protein